MAIAVTVKADFAAALRTFAKVPGQVRFAAARTLTGVAGVVHEAEQREIRDVFDRPTPYTLGSLFKRSATKANLTATVWLKGDTSKGTPADRYLMPQIKGGARSLKRFERALRSVGALPNDHVAVPASAAKRDAYGNMDRGQIVQILAYFKAFPEAGYRANTTDARRAKLAKGTKKKQGFAYFVGRAGDGRGPLGVWQRTHFAMGSALKMVLLFVPSVRYQSVLPFEQVADRVIAREWPRQFPGNLREALATARA